MTRRVIVTRPAQEAPRWVEELRRAGLDAQALPLIAIEPVHDDSALREARRRTDRHDALMFVSAAAVTHFFGGDAPSPSFFAGADTPRCWATGPGTVRALQQAGVPAWRIDAPPTDAGQFDSEALWARVRSQIGVGSGVLMVRGGDVDAQPTGRNWLAREITAAGGQVQTLVAYRRLTPVLDAAAQRLASDAAADGTVWLFSSSEAIANLCTALPDADWRAARAVVTHARIGKAARKAGFGVVRLSQPEPAALVASIESFA